MGLQPARLKQENNRNHMYRVYLHRFCKVVTSVFLRYSYPMRVCRPQGRRERENLTGPRRGNDRKRGSMQRFCRQQAVTFSLFRHPPRGGSAAATFPRWGKERTNPLVLPIPSFAWRQMPLSPPGDGNTGPPRAEPGRVSPARPQAIARVGQWRKQAVMK